MQKGRACGGRLWRGGICLTLLEELRALLPDAKEVSDALLALLLRRAEAFILSYCRRASLSPQLIPVQTQLAVVFFNRMGIEGESAHDEGSVRRTLDALPREIRQTLTDQRLVQAVMRYAP